MPSPDDIVVRRSSGSAAVFWSKPRASHEVCSTNGKEKLIEKKPTPYSRQHPPFSANNDVSPPLRHSRSIERILLQEEMKRVETEWHPHIAEDKIKDMRKQILTLIRVNRGLCNLLESKYI